MINIKEFLLKSNLEVGTYALVSYNGKTEATWFTKYDNWGEDGHTWFLESPCVLYRIADVDKPIKEFAEDYASSLVEEDDIESYAEQWVLPMIVDNVLYEIENFQCSPYLPKEVDAIKLIDERECLEYLLDRVKSKN